jgi:hypothetical protein
MNPPAPITTLDNPLHSVVKPSTREIVTMAFDMPLYIAPGDGLRIWILVFPESARRPQEFTGPQGVVYLQQVHGIHDGVLLHRS